jgi:SRSO17 transposase
VSFATKPTLARQMIARTLAAGVPAGWVSADEVYGADPQLRDELERRGLGYVLAVARDHRVPTVAGPTRADMLTLQLPARAWQPLSAGAGAKGDRVYDWAPIDIPSRRLDTAGCWSAGTAAPANAPIAAATHRRRRR